MFLESGTKLSLEWGSISSWVGVVVNFFGFFLAFIIFSRQNTIKLDIKLMTAVGTLLFNIINKSWFDVDISSIGLYVYQRDGFKIKKRKLPVQYYYTSNRKDIKLVKAHRNDQHDVDNVFFSMLFDKERSDNKAMAYFDKNKPIYFQIVLTDFRNKRNKSNILKVKEPNERLFILTPNEIDKIEEETCRPTKG